MTLFSRSRILRAPLLSLSVATALVGAAACGNSGDEAGEGAGASAHVGRADGGSAYDNATACQQFVTAATCGALGEPLRGECTTYAAEPCDLSAYFSCLASKYVCTNGRYDDGALATVGECSAKIPADCGPESASGAAGMAGTNQPIDGGAHAVTSGSTGTGAATAGVSLEVNGSRESNVYGVSSSPPAGSIWLYVDLTLTNDTATVIPLSASAFSVELVSGVQYSGYGAGGDAEAGMAPGCVSDTSVSPGRSFECVEVFAIPQGAATTTVGYTVPLGSEVTATLTATPCVPCGDACVDVTTDSMNCGACGTVVGLGTCVDGEPSCQAGTTACNGTCVNLQSDPRNCGACGHAVAIDGVCSGGAPACAFGYTACGSSCVNVQGSDPENCGGCGTVCPSGTTCSGGTCAGYLSSTANETCSVVCGSLGCRETNWVFYNGVYCPGYDTDYVETCSFAAPATLQTDDCVAPFAEISCSCGR